jgi:hypothetical protein
MVISVIVVVVVSLGLFMGTIDKEDWGDPGFSTRIDRSCMQR